MPEDVPHLTTEAFRTIGHRLVDWIADYWDSVEALPVRSTVVPGAVAGMLPSSPPEAPGGSGEWERILADLDRVVLPGTTHWQHPGFFAYFPANTSGPSVLAELVTAGLGSQGMLWQTSPAMTEVETRVLDWLAELMGLPEAFRSDAIHPEQGGGVIQGTASEGTLVALLAAREAARDANPSAALSDLTVYVSSQAHSSVVKAAMIAGLARTPTDHSQVRLVPHDAQLRMRPDALASLIQADKEAGRVPTWVCATVGTTATTAVDPVAAIAEVIRQEAPDIWLHIDAAFAGAAAVCPEHRYLLRGAESARSIVVNAHKWLLTNFDCSMLWTSDRAAVLRALSITPAYLRNAASDSGAVIDYRDWQIPLGRRFRALKLWWVIRHYGAEGLRKHIRAHIDWAAWFEEAARAHPLFDVVFTRTVSLVCFRFRGDDAANRHLADRVNATGRVFLTPTVVPARSVGGNQVILRMAIGGTRTTFEHVEAAWELITKVAESLDHG